MTQDTKKIHEGRNIKRFREMMGIKQDVLAAELGDDWNQQKVSLLEQKETVDAVLLQQVAVALKVPVAALQNFDEEQVVNIISNTFNDQSNGYNYYPQFHINPVEKWFEALEEIKRLNAELLKVKDEQIALLKGMVR